MLSSPVGCFACSITRSVAWCSASVWSAPDGSGLLTLDGSSVQTDPDGSRRIVWMIKRMIKQGKQIMSARRVAVGASEVEKIS